LYFVLLIGVPSIAMGILAFRGIKNDQALVEKISRQEALDKGEGIIQNLDTSLTAIEEKIKSLPADQSGYTELTFQDSLLSGFVKQNNSIVGVFRKYGQGFKLLKENLIYSIPGSAKYKEKYEYRSLPSFVKGWKLEFAEKDLDNALVYYKDLLGNVNHPGQRAFIQNIIARINKKMGNLTTAIKEYGALKDSFPFEWINPGIPCVLIADIELAKIYISQEEEEKSVHHLVELTKTITEQRYDLDQSSFNIISRQMSDIKDRLTPRSSPKDSLLFESLNSNLKALSLQEFRTKELLELLSDLNDKPSNNGFNRPPNHRKSWTSDLRQNDYLFAPIWKEDSLNYLILYDQDSLVNKFIVPELSLANNDTHWSWSLKHKDEYSNSGWSASFKDKTDFIELNFPGNLISYSLQAYLESKSFIDTLIPLGKSLYFYVFLFVFLILALGLIFTMQYSNREFQLNELKSKFLANVSHEFKSPLSAIIQISEMLRSDMVPEGKKKKYYDVIFKQSQRLNHLIQNILDFSSIEKGRKKYVFKEEDLTPLIEKSINRLNQRISDQDFNINYTLEKNLPKVMMDQEALQLAIYNLLDNAVKYSGDSRTVDVETWKENGNLLTAIKDYGIGLRKEEIPKIFERYYRSETNHNENIKGSGLGLSLVKEIIKAHGGNVSVESKHHEGSTFRFSLPLKK
jgi:signal transduction histidine kinase